MYESSVDCYKQKNVKKYILTELLQDESKKFT